MSDDDIGWADDEVAGPALHCVPTPATIAASYAWKDWPFPPIRYADGTQEPIEDAIARQYPKANP